MHFREHRLPQSPDRVHHFARVSGIRLADRNQNQVVEDALGRHADVADFGQLQAHQRQENALDRLAHVEVFHRRRPDDGRRVDRILALRDAGDVEHRVIVVERIEAGVIAERSFACAARPVRHSLRARSPRSRELRDRTSRTSPSRPACRAGIPRSSSRRDRAAAAESRSTSWPDRRRSPPRRPCALLALLLHAGGNVPRPACGSASACRSCARRRPACGTCRSCACRYRDCARTPSAA